MALTVCKECGGMVSDKATVCPHCGAPVADAAAEEIHRADAASMDGAFSSSDAPSDRRAAHGARPTGSTPTGARPVDVDSPVRPKRKGRMVLIFVVGVLLVLALTVPDRDAHRAAVAEPVKAAVTQEVGDRMGAEGQNLFSAFIVRRVTDAVFDELFRVSNYGVCSVGTMQLGKHRHVLSIGVLGYVFTLYGEDDFRKALRKYLPFGPDDAGESGRSGDSLSPDDNGETENAPSSEADGDGDDSEAATSGSDNLL